MKKLLKILLTLFIICILFMPSFSYAAQVHRVTSGESLYLIAEKYEVTTNALIENNPFLQNPNIIFLDQVIIIPETSESMTYRVKVGDTIYKISQKLGVSMEELVEANNLTDWDTLYIGQILSVPPNNYTVKSGDTLYLISQKFGISINALAEENNISNLDYIYVGQILTIPRSELNNGNSDFKDLVNPLAQKYPDTFYLKGSSNRRRIALTFDDGPDEIYTPQILDILKTHNVKATFFLLGSKVKEQPELVNRIINEGHIIGNHSWTHPDLRKVTSEQLVYEIKQTENAIMDVTGLTTCIMRPPYGAVNENVIEQLQELNYKVINWNIDTVDWRAETTSDDILINTLPNITKDAIVLMHDSPGDKSATVNSLAELITTLSKNGYTFVTTDEMLEIQAYR